jgi:hypothetical protein
MPPMMEIEFFGDCGDEPWAIFTKGHVDLDAFKAAAAPKIKHWDVEREAGNATLGHFYMRDMQAQGQTEDADEEHPWHWCVEGEAGAVPVTAYKF